MTEENQARFLKCIGEPTRLQILKFLANGEKCVGDIIQNVQREQSLVSHHLKALKECNIVVARHEAQKIYYSLADPMVAEIVTSSASLLSRLKLCEDGKCCE
jgi:DNA-binding transcriptional ArsR family regulator